MLKNLEAENIIILKINTDKHTGRSLRISIITAHWPFFAVIMVIVQYIAVIFKMQYTWFIIASFTVGAYVR